MEHYLTWGGEGGLKTNPIRFGSYEGLEQREKRGEKSLNWIDECL